MSTTLDTDARYTVDGYRGVAFYVIGWAQVTTEPEPFLTCDDQDCEHDDETCWVMDEPEVVDSDTWVRAVMVGDDAVHEVEVTDLHKLSDDDYCTECGQIGCTADGRAS